jgi:hypothetical protein
MTMEQIACNPEVDYTRYAGKLMLNCQGPAATDTYPSRPDLISLVFSDVGSLTPEGVSQYLVGMFAG